MTRLLRRLANALLFRPVPVVETYPVGDYCPYSVWYVTTGNVPAWGSDYATSLDSFWTVVGDTLNS